jgi:D-alanyl-D-alanine carboxypeptidase (penicillin-binding protein 5/6)
MVYKEIMNKFLILLILLFPVFVQASEITADSYLLVEADSFAVVAGKDYHRELPPASTTKVMTTILALEKLEGQESIVPTKKVLSIPASKLSLDPGAQYRAMDLIRGTMVKSANDAAYTLATHIAGSEEQFARMMNEKAREIGAHNTHFVNASGLYERDHLTSAYDLALMFRYALENKRFQEIVATKYFLFKRGNQDIKYMNHNRFLFCFAPSLGGKTGFTRLSKHCYVGAFEKEGKVYLLSMLGSRNLWGDAVHILKEIYTEVPSKREITLARATNHLSLSSYVVAKKVSKTAVKKQKRAEGKKKFKKTAKGKHRFAGVR